MKNVLIIGWGSIGKQHYEVLKSLNYDCAVVTSQSVDVPHYVTLKEALRHHKPFYVVVANQTSSHFDTLTQLIAYSYQGSVLVEKPLYHKPCILPRHSFHSIGVGYQLRFHPVLLTLRELIKDSKVLSCHCYCGQYLPDWRSNSDYRLSYSSSKDRGGGVLRDLSHEIDYLIWLFGVFTSLYAHGGKFSSLEISSEDTVGILCGFQRCPVATVQLNYCDRVARRELIVVCDDKTITCNLRLGIISVDQKEIYTPKVDKQSLLLSLHQNILDNKIGSFCTQAEGEGVVSIVDRIEALIYGL